MQTEFSDHELLILDAPTFKVGQFNLAQFGVLQFFKNESGFVLSSTLLISSVTSLLRKYKSECNDLAQKLEAIGLQSVSTADINALIETESKKIGEVLKKMGFPIKHFEMVAGRLFNENRKGDEMIKTPQFILEDAESFTERTKQGFAYMLGSSDIVCVQEMCVSKFFDVDFTAIQDANNANYPEYDHIDAPHIKSTINVTYFNKSKFVDVTSDHTERVTALRDDLKCFTVAENRLLCVALQDLHSKEVYLVANVHAEYPKANVSAVWRKLRDVLTQKNVIVCGDFNLAIENKQLFESKFTGFDCQYVMIPTPETANVGPPTLDFIFVSH